MAAAGIDEIENIGRRIVAALVSQAAVDAVLLGQGLTEARIDIVGVLYGGDGCLEIVLETRRIRRWEKLEQAERCRVDPVGWNQIARERASLSRIASGFIARIVNGYGALGADGLREIAGALEQRGHGLGAGGATARAPQLIVEGESPLGVIEQVRNLQGPAEHHAGARFGVSRLGRVLTVDGVASGIPNRIVERERCVAVVLCAGIAASVAERGYAGPGATGTATLAAATWTATSAARAATPPESASAESATASSERAAASAGSTAAGARGVAAHAVDTDAAHAVNAQTSAGAAEPVILLRHVQAAAHTAVDHEGSVGALAHIGRGRISECAFSAGDGIGVSRGIHIHALIVVGLGQGRAAAAPLCRRCCGTRRGSRNRFCRGDRRGCRWR